jgi:hypothetical protein
MQYTIYILHATKATSVPMGAGNTTHTIFKNMPSNLLTTNRRTLQMNRKK